MFARVITAQAGEDGFDDGAAEAGLSSLRLATYEVAVQA
jgi:hypothetical protein